MILIGGLAEPQGNEQASYNQKFPDTKKPHLKADVITLYSEPLSEMKIDTPFPAAVSESASVDTRYVTFVNSGN